MRIDPAELASKDLQTESNANGDGSDLHRRHLPRERIPLIFVRRIRFFLSCRFRGFFGGGFCGSFFGGGFLGGGFFCGSFCGGFLGGGFRGSFFGGGFFDSRRISAGNVIRSLHFFRSNGLRRIGRVLFGGRPGIAAFVFREEILAVGVNAERFPSAASSLFEEGMTAKGAIVLHGHIPGHKIALCLFVLTGQVFTAIVSVLPSVFLTFPGTFHQSAAALGTPPGHFDDERHGKAAIREPRAGQEASEASGFHDKVGRMN